MRKRCISVCAAAWIIAALTADNAAAELSLVLRDSYYVAPSLREVKTFTFDGYIRRTPL